MFKQLLYKKSNRIIVAVFILMVLLSAAIFALNSTLAAPSELIILTSPNSYTEIEKGTTRNVGAAGVLVFEVNNSSLASAAMNGGVLQVTGLKAGPVAVAVSSSGGFVGVFNYQITDSNNISQYTLRDNGEVVLNIGKTKIVPVDIPSGKTPVVWTSSNITVASVNSSSGVITGYAKGATIVIGEFTDKWGVKQHIHILVGVETSLSGNKLGELLEWIKKGEVIIALNPNPYTSASIKVLSDAVNAGKSVLEMANPTDQDIVVAINGIDNAIKNLKTGTTGSGNIIPGPDGNYYRPVGRPPKIYEKVDADGKSKYPPEYVYNPDGNPGNGNDRPAYLHNGGYWVEDPPYSNIWKEVDNNGNPSNEKVIWGGPDGKPGGGDDKNVTKFGNDWWVDMGQNVWRKVTGRFTLGPLTGGGPNESPSTTPVYEIYDNTAKDGKYYVGQLGPDSSNNYYFYGDKPTGSGGDGKLNSTAIYLAPSDQKYYLDANGNMVITPPVNVGTITDITISGPESVMTGSGAQYQATVVGTGGSVSQAVTWQVFDANKSDTRISNGFLTIATDETATSVIIRATSSVTTSVFKDYEVYVTKKLPPDVIVGGDKNYYKPIGNPKNVYVKVDDTGSPLTYPPQYVYNPDGNPGNGNDSDAYAHNGAFYVEDPPYSNIWKPVNNNGTLSNDNVIWGGPDGKPGGGDDKNVTKFGNEWWIDMGQNVWRRVTGRFTLGPLTGGGPNESPSTTPVYEIYDNTAKDGKYYVGQLGPDSSNNYYFYGDKPTGSGGDGKLNSTATYLAPSDQKYYLDANGNMVTTPPVNVGTVTGITISGPSSLPTNGNGQFYATVTGTGGSVSQAVTWQVIGGKAGTTIVNGFLTIAADETATSVTVRATSSVTPSVFKDYTVTITQKTVIVPTPDASGAINGIVIPATKVNDSSDWLAIATKKVSGIDYLLIVRMNALPNYCKYMPNNSDKHTYGGSIVKANLENWYNNTGILSGLRAYAVPSDATTQIGSYATLSDPNGFSSPMTGVYTYPFALSFQEYSNYLSCEWRNAKGGNTPSSQIAKNNWARLPDRGCATSWARSPAGTIGIASGLYKIGRVACNINCGGNGPEGLRPAIWVRATIIG